MTSVFLIIVYLICVLSGTDFRNRGTKILFILVPVMIILVVTRPDTLPDITGYKQVIQNDLEHRWEPSFYVINYIGHLFGNPVTIVFLIYALISVIGRVYFLKRISPYFWGSMIVYTSYYFIYNDMIQMRAAVATMLLLPIMKSVIERNIKLFFALVFLASLFHYSAAIFCIIYFIKPFEIKAKLWIGAIVLSFTLVSAGFYLTPLIDLIGFAPIHSLFIHYYVDSDIDEAVNVFSVLHVGQVICAMFMLIKINRISSVSPYFILALKLFVIGLCIKTTFSDLPVVANRSSELFTSIEIFLIPTAFYGYFKNKRFSYLLTVAYSLVFFVYSLKSWF